MKTKILVGLIFLFIFISCITEEVNDSDEIELSREGKLLFKHFSFKSGDPGEYYTYGKFAVENNLWNASGLTERTYSQRIYHYHDESTDIFGWKWSFPEDAYGINSYPEIIFGWKPWYPESTTPDLPIVISDITKLKVTYDCEVAVNSGEYNLAFDNWIGYTDEVNPPNIRYEFMIWEDYQNLTAFGDYKGTVTTSNGNYRFYLGYSHWEPEGCDWTYLAFIRVSKRTSGVVDVDELIDYLVDNNIVSPDLYLYSIEFGNEAGNSVGYNVMKNFEVNIE